jgi:hypothetical protein
VKTGVPGTAGIDGGFFRPMEHFVGTVNSIDVSDLGATIAKILSAGGQTVTEKSTFQMELNSTLLRHNRCEGEGGFKPMKRIWVVLSLLGMVLAACATPAGPVVSAVTATPMVPRVTDIPVEFALAERAAIAALAAQLGIPADQIMVVSSEAVTWKDGCLGVVRMGVMCIQGQVAGFRIMLRANSQEYEFHSNQDGSVLVDATGKATQPPAGTPETEPTDAPKVEPTHVPVDVPPVQRAAVAAAMLALGLPVGQVKLVSIEPVDWPDGCLGVTHIGMMCIKGPVPGFRIILEANGKQYEFHTNLDGTVVTPASGPAVEVPGAIVGRVKTALASGLGISVSDIQVVSAQIIEWPDSCLGVAAPGIACAQMVTPGYLVVLEAKGQQYEYHTNGNASVVKPASLALSWHRNGGIAGFADSLTVFRSGEVHADWSRAQNGSKDSTLSALSLDQQAQLQGWLAKFGTVSVSHHDPANATDQMAIDLTLLGGGSGQPSAAEQQAMLDWAGNVLTGLQQ